MISDVPQGSVLVPLLFLIYIDSISTLRLTEGSKFSLYADDMLLYRTISSAVDNDYVKLQEDIDQIYGCQDGSMTKIPFHFQILLFTFLFVSFLKHMHCIALG